MKVWITKRQIANLEKMSFEEAKVSQAKGRMWGVWRWTGSEWVMC